MKSIYAELNRQKELKRTYHRRYKNLQAAVATTTDTPVMTSYPVAVTSSKTISAHITKLLPLDNKRKHLIKERPNPMVK